MADEPFHGDFWERRPPAPVAPEVGALVRDGGDPIDLDRVLELLGADRRRRVLSYLRDADENRVAVDELVEAVAAREAEAEDRSIDRRRLAISLHHNHLPKLEQAGLVEYDADAGWARYCPNELVERLLDEADRGEDLLDA